MIYIYMIYVNIRIYTYIYIYIYIYDTRVRDDCVAWQRGELPRVAAIYLWNIYIYIYIYIYILRGDYIYIYNIFISQGGV